MNEHLSSNWHPSAKDHYSIASGGSCFAKGDGPVVELDGLGFEGMTAPALQAMGG